MVMSLIWNSGIQMIWQAPIIHVILISNLKCNKLKTATILFIYIWYLDKIININNRHNWPALLPLIDSTGLHDFRIFKTFFFRIAGNLGGGGSQNSTKWSIAKRQSNFFVLDLESIAVFIRYLLRVSLSSVIIHTTFTKRATAPPTHLQHI